MKKKNIVKIALIICVLSLFIIPSTYSIFRGKTIGGGNLALAKWNVTLNSSNQNGHLSIIPEPENVDASYTLSITSNSDVNVVYSVVIDNLPSGVSVKIDNGNFIAESNHKVIFTNAGIIRYSDSEKTKSHVLTFKASNGVTFVNEQEVDIDVIASQQMPS